MPRGYCLSSGLLAPGITCIMSRILGGGRVLGNGGSLSPAVAHPQRSSSLLSPSASSISLPSQVSTSQISGEDHDNDFGSKIVLDHGVPLSGEAPTSKLVCPICNEDMVCPARLPPEISY